MRITLQYFAACPNWRALTPVLERLADEFGASLEHRAVETPEEAARIGFRGSPTVLIDGEDPFAVGDEPFGLACRVFVSPEGLVGSPSEDQLRAAFAERAGAEPTR